MGNIKHWLLAASSGVVLAIAWPETLGATSLIFLAFSPLLTLEDKVSKEYNKSGKTIFGYAYLTFFIFNLITTWWIYYASAWGAVAAIIFNSLFMAVVFWLFHITKQKVGRKEGYISLVIYWIAFEYLHLNWDLSWPWLTLGNVFSNTPQSVQWFEYTGVLGGTLWVLVGNLIFYYSGKVYQTTSKRNGLILMIILLALVFIPKLWSKSVYDNYTQDSNGEVDVVIIQPNIDPYKDKFSGMAESEQIDLMVDLAREKVDEETDLLVLPETAFPAAYWEHEVEFLYGTEELRKIIDEYPHLRIITGLSTSRLFVKGEELPPTARKLGDVGYYDNYNTAMQLDSSELVAFHRKSKLVLGVEKVPFIKYVPLMKKLSINLGGAAGGYGSQEHPTVFFKNNEFKGIAPIICYESVYGEYVNEYAKDGAELYAIITNDGWWDNSPGYKQHLAYARLRAIEGRRDIVRSANTGISAIINSRGEIVERTKWWVPTALKGKVQLNDEITFYIKYGDYFGRIAAFVAVLLVLLTIVKTLNKTEQRLNAGKK
ncbi:MAG: apolipoprotein N-acyltransferase [Vicingaceae bacterium]